MTIHQYGMELDAALREVGSQVGINVVFGTDVVRGEGARDVQLSAISAAEALRRLLEDTALEAYVTPAGGVVIMGRTARPASARETETEFRGQTVRGRVVDRATKTPLIGANVIVTDTDPILGTSTDSGGRFVIEHVPLGRQSVRVSYIGYQPVVIPNLMVTSAKEVVLSIALDEQVFEGREIVVVPEVRKDQPLNEMAVVSARSFSVEETRRYAGGLDDPARMASSFAGVTTGAGIQENAVVIRGNAPKGVQWRLEGVEIPNPNHFAGHSRQLVFDAQFHAGLDVRPRTRQSRRR